VQVTQQALTLELNVSPESLDFGIAAGSQQFSITSNVNWTVSRSASWLTISSASGSGNTTITGSGNGTIAVTVSENNTSNVRTAAITIVGSGITRTVQVMQQASAIELTVSPESLIFEADDDIPQQITVNSNINWMAVSSNNIWVTITPSLDSNNGVITVTVSRNNTGSVRTALITISDRSSNLTRTVEVKQAPVPVLDVPEQIEIGASGNAETLRLTSNIDWTASSAASWA
jgi:hypothetical protein